MNHSKQLADRFREVFLNGTWIANTNYKEQLSGLSWEQANQTVGAHNSILALTYHINYYLDGILNVFRGGSLDIHDKFSFDCQHLYKAEDWMQLREALFNNAESFALHIAKLSEKELDAVFVKASYGSYRRNIEGVIEHSYYHLGQIVLIKKLTNTTKP